MHKIVISDTSTLILFHKIDEFNLLQKYMDKNYDYHLRENNDAWY